MLSVKVLGVLLPALVVLVDMTQGQDKFAEYYRWKQAAFNFPPGQEPSGDDFIVKNTPITAIKIQGDVMYLTTPRYRDGVPVTLSTVPYNRRYMGNSMFGPSNGMFADQNVNGPKLTPFPSYDMQKVGDCTALQMVQSMEVDEYQRLWVVDLGRSSVLEPEPKNSCPARLVVFDTKVDQRTNPEGKNILFTYEFPDEVVSRTDNVIKDIQVACATEDDCWVYISDLMASRLVVYNTKMDKSWTVKHISMEPEPDQAIVTIDGHSSLVPFGITGLGLSPRDTNFSTLYYSPLASDKIYRVETSVLQNQPAVNNELDIDDVILYGDKSGQSDGFAMTSAGQLHYGILPKDSVYVTDTGPNVPLLATQTSVARSREQLSWPDTFSFDGKGKLLLTSTKFHLWQANELDENEFNYRVMLLTHGSDFYPYNKH